MVSRVLYLTPLAVHAEAGFDHVPGGPEYNNRSVFSYHVYCAYVDSVG